MTAKYSIMALFEANDFLTGKDE